MGRRRGFSLIELVVVVTIMGIVAAMAVPRFASASAHRRLDGAAQRILADLRQAQQHALASSTDVTVTFELDSDTYTVNAPSPLGTATSYQVALAEGPTAAEIDAVTLASCRVTFNEFGIPTLGGDVTIRVGQLQRTITLTAGSLAISTGTTARVPVAVPADLQDMDAEADQ